MTDHVLDLAGNSNTESVDIPLDEGTVFIDCTEAALPELPELPALPDLTVSTFAEAEVTLFLPELCELPAFPEHDPSHLKVSSTAERVEVQEDISSIATSHLNKPRQRNGRLEFPNAANIAFIEEVNYQDEVD